MSNKLKCPLNTKYQTDDVRTNISKDPYNRKAAKTNRNKKKTNPCNIQNLLSMNCLYFKATKFPLDN